MLTAAVAVFVGITAGVAAFGDDDTEGVVVRVIDGDTLVAQVDGDEERIRLLNIDTPETKDPDEPVQCLGPEASAFLEKRLAPGTEIELEYDEERTDRYGRTLAGVFEGGSLVNAEIAAAGLGVPVVFEPNDRFLAEVQSASDDAQRDEKGLFDPEVECTLPAQLDALGAAADEAPTQATGDPADALDAAAETVGDADAFIVGLSPDTVSTLGNAVFAADSMSGALGDIKEAATDHRDRAEHHRADLEAAKSSYDEEQRQEAARQKKREEDLRKKAEEDRQRQEEQRQRQEDETSSQQATRKPRSEPAREAPSTSSSAPRSEASTGSAGSTGKSRSTTSRSSGSSGSSGSQRSTGSKKPSTSGSASGKPSMSGSASGESRPKSSSSSKSGAKESSSSGGRSSGSSSSKGASCTPYGPEVAYSDAGGYTGKRYGMPGGKTFRKCR